MSTNQSLKKKEEIFEFNRLYNNFHLFVLGNQKLEIIKPQLIKIIEILVENLIESDKNDPEIFNLFKQNQFISELVILFNKRERDINLQIIKSFSLLVTNISNKENLDFLFESNFINEILTLENENIDNDYLYYYINFIKQLTLKINEKTIQYFYNKETYSFHMLTNMLKFYNHSDQMVRNVIKNTFLTILSLSKNFQPSLNFICSLPVLSYFNFLGCRMRDMIKTYNKKIKNNKIDEVNYLHDEIINDIMYIQDIFSLNIPIITFILTNTIFYYVIFTEIYASFIFEKPIISLKCCFYILILFLKYIKEEGFINCLIGVLFLDKLHHRLIEQIKNPPEFLPNYEADWEPLKKKKKIPFEDYITFNFNKEFILLLYNNTSIYSENKKIYKKIQEKKKVFPDLESNEDELYKSILNVLNDIIKKKDVENVKKYHNIISKTTGIQTGLSYHYDIKCPINVIRKTFELTKLSLSSEISNTKFMKNEIKSNFFIFLDSNDENLIFLISNFLYFIFHNQYISKELLSFINLANPEFISKNQKENNKNDFLEDIKMLNINNNQENKGEKNFINDKLDFSTYHEILKWKKLSLSNKESLNNEILKKYFIINQSIYNYDCTSKYLNLIIYPPQNVFRQTTFVLIFEVLKYFILYKNEEGIEKPLNIESIHKNKIRNLMISISKSLIALLDKKFEIKTCCFEFLQEQINLIKRYNDINYVSNIIINNSYILFPNELIDSIVNYPEIFKNVKGDVNKYKKSLFSFLLFYDIYAKTFGIKKIDYPSKFIESTIEEPKKILFEINNKKKEGSYQIINDEFIFIEDNKKEVMNILNISININEDKKSGKILNLSNLKEFKISFFDDIESLDIFKRNIEEKIKLINDTYYNSMKLFFETIIENDKNIK